ncbi:MAG: thiosulfate oxidation carrier complex protein SoxZ [Gammaproteobacteria bacterium]|nr:thiosulfate oxidation carrier complex protein SoxZ [Gammaproteobacteria bacterium]
MKPSIKMRIRKDGDEVVVKALISHPMETGRRVDQETGETIPAHFIQTVIAEYEGKKVFTAYWGTGVSQNPFISFKFKGGEESKVVTLSWFDNKGQSDSLETEI